MAKFIKIKDQDKHTVLVINVDSITSIRETVKDTGPACKIKYGAEDSFTMHKKIEYVEDLLKNATEY